MEYLYTWRLNYCFISFFSLENETVICLESITKPRCWIPFEGIKIYFSWLKKRKQKNKTIKQKKGKIEWILNFLRKFLELMTIQRKTTKLVTPPFPDVNILDINMIRIFPINADHQRDLVHQFRNAFK